MRNDKRLTRLEQQQPTGRIVVIDCRGKTPAEIVAEMATTNAGDTIIRIVERQEEGVV